jgi:ATP-binding cassette subfamily B protein
MNVWRLSWRVSQHRPRDFWVGSGLFVLFFAMPAATGYFLSRGYQTVAVGDVGRTVRWALAVAAAETVRMVAVHWGAIVWTRVWLHMQSLLRANMLAAQLASGGAEAGQPVASAGAALTHFRDDTEDVANFVDISLDTVGALVFTALAGFVLGSVEPRGAAILVVPMVAVVVVTRVLDPKIKAYRRADREATGEVTGLLGDVMAAATTVKVNDASDSVMARLDVLVGRRQHTAVRDRVLEEGVFAFSQGASDLGLGLVLLVSAGALANGRFDVGELALFAAYAGWLSFLPRMVGRLLARRKQAAVAFERMGGLVADELPSNTVLARHLPIGVREVRERPCDPRPGRRRLERLDVIGLGAVYANGGGVVDVSFTIRRGDFVVVTGPIGSGKSTLLRAILGLAWQADVSGAVRWNDEEIDDRAAFFVPPNAAFLSQTPQLISDSVVDNVGLGPVGVAQVERALDIAAIADDIAEMPAGTGTMIGPRGLRLSGGQRQRLATARALVHEPELLVLDDLSSALDVETELTLWKNLANAGATVIAVSHRSIALERADQIIRLDGGRQESNLSDGLVRPV